MSGQTAIGPSLVLCLVETELWQVEIESGETGYCLNLVLEFSYNLRVPKNFIFNCY